MEGMSMSIAKMGDKTRSENPMMQGTVNLHLMDAQKMIMMSPANKTYIEQPLNPKEAPSLDDPRPQRLPQGRQYDGDDGGMDKMKECSSSR
jgi:hypothetical protein